MDEQILNISNIQIGFHLAILIMQASILPDRMEPCGGAEKIKIQKLVKQNRKM